MASNWSSIKLEVSRASRTGVFSSFFSILSFTQLTTIGPTTATEGIQFGDDTSTRIYRSGTGAITVAGSLTYPTATVSGYITFPNDTNAAGLINTAGTAWLKLDDAYGNMYIVNNQSGAGIYFDSNAYYWRNSNGATTLLSLSGNGDLGAARYLSGTYVNTSDDVSTGNISSYKDICV